jgi:hypothetical protein
MQGKTPANTNQSWDCGLVAGPPKFPYKEEAGGSSPSTPTKNTFEYWDFSVSGSELFT